jgi:hypothetical protein
MTLRHTGKDKHHAITVCVSNPTHAAILSRNCANSETVAVAIFANLDSLYEFHNNLHYRLRKPLPFLGRGRFTLLPFLFDARRSPHP